MICDCLRSVQGADTLTPIAQPVEYLSDHKNELTNLESLL